jgi:hypothetical protein
MGKGDMGSLKNRGIRLSKSNTVLIRKVQFGTGGGRRESRFIYLLIFCNTEV